MKLAVLGNGAWGTALAVRASLQATHSVLLWGRDDQQMQAIQQTRTNVRYLPGVGLPPNLLCTSSTLMALPRLLDACDLVLLATPVAGLRGMLSALADLPKPVVWLCKGFEGHDDESAGLLPHEVAARVAPTLQVGALSGPSFAQEVARGLPVALVAASSHESVRGTLVQALHGPGMRVYANEDLVGVEVGGAVKNVLAIATGLCDGLELGHNARAALITRGLAEMTRLGLALGARVETFMGLGGLGDLVLTATGALSRNRQVGLALARGESLDQVVQTLGHVAEGVRCAASVVGRAKTLNIEMPIAEAVQSVLRGVMTPKAAVQALLQRDPVAEVA